MVHDGSPEAASTLYAVIKSLLSNAGVSSTALNHTLQQIKAGLENQGVEITMRNVIKAVEVAGRGVQGRYSSADPMILKRIKDAPGFEAAAAAAVDTASIESPKTPTTAAADDVDMDNNEEVQAQNANGRDAKGEAAGGSDSSEEDEAARPSKKRTRSGGANERTESKTPASPPRALNKKRKGSAKAAPVRPTSDFARAAAQKAANGAMGRGKQ
ncbi:hypothetical protein DMC30DRAFT_401832 [Rhodotorula diobovata]|uniref:Uncharacterized protein n=1 Tax=Rhodotorula diobovata TaxID=5288 RepID=A0A5C5FSF8_9BASI|nr:hypothetical protein DMC30DRAFT_401832 [Rhodotorula diobovata]